MSRLQRIASRIASMGPAPSGPASFTVTQEKLREIDLFSDTFPYGHPAHGGVNDFNWSLQEKYRASKIENPEDAMGGGMPVIVEGTDGNYWVWYGDLDKEEEFISAFVGHRMSERGL